jgi:Domain of unknown function (DUF4384)
MTPPWQRLWTAGTLLMLAGCTAPATPGPTVGPLAVQTWVDADPSGARVPTYTPGQHLTLAAMTNRAATVYLFSFGPDGRVDMIWPNAWSSNLFGVGETRQIPAAGDRFEFQISAPYGQNEVYAVAVRSPLEIPELLTISAQHSFATFKRSAAALRADLAAQLAQRPADEWATDLALYQVAP